MLGGKGPRDGERCECECGRPRGSARWPCHEPGHLLAVQPPPSLTRRLGFEPSRQPATLANVGARPVLPNGWTDGQCAVNRRGKCNDSICKVLRDHPVCRKSELAKVPKRLNMSSSAFSKRGRARRSRRAVLGVARHNGPGGPNALPTRVYFKPYVKTTDSGFCNFPIINSILDRNCKLSSCRKQTQSAAAACMCVSGGPLMWFYGGEAAE